ncbi:hypothetical protein ATER59S_05492 [Aquamicrobium terrae]
MATNIGTMEQPAPKPRRRLRAEERWEQILTVSAELFSSNGYHGASLDDIGERLGIQKAALYHYVRSKEDILVEIYDRMLTRAETEVLPIADEPFAPDERLRRMVSRYIGLMIEQADMWSLIHYQQNALPAANYEATLRRKRAFEKKFEGVVKEGQASGLFKPMSTRLMVLSLFGMCNYVHHWIRFVHFTEEEITGVICEVLERGFIDDGDKRVGAWPRYVETSDAMAETAAKLDDLNQQVKELQAAFDRDRHRLIDGFAGPPAVDGAGWKAKDEDVQASTSRLQASAAKSKAARPAK